MEMETKTLDQLTPEQVADLERLKGLIKSSIRLKIEDHGLEVRKKRITAATLEYVEARDNSERDKARHVIERESDASHHRGDLEEALGRLKGTLLDEIGSKYGPTIADQCFQWAQQFYYV